MHDFGDIQGQKVPVVGGGRCIYCGSDGGSSGLRDEHIIPFSLGGNTELLAASCADCEKITSYLDGYLANATYKHVRVHSAIQSRSGHPDVLPAVVEINGNERAFDLAPSEHPYFLHMPVWHPPGIMCGLQPSPDFGPGKVNLYWYVPPDFRETMRLGEGDFARIMDRTPPPNFSTFARSIAKIAYCHAVLMLGLGGFRPLTLPSIILGRYPNIPYFVGSDLGDPPPPEPRQILHLIQRTNVTYRRWKLLTVRVRLFAQSGTPANGMPFYEVVVGAEGRGTVTPRLMRSLPRVIAL
jgi:hypothetical protein